MTTPGHTSIIKTKTNRERRQIKEPVAPGNPLLGMDNVIVTPHSANYSDAAFRQQRIIVGQEAARVLSGQWPRNAVNPTVKPKVNLLKED